MTTTRTHTATPVRTWAISPAYVVCKCGREIRHYIDGWSHVDNDPTLPEDVPGNPAYDDIYMESLLEQADA